jgi:SpoIID/LytB domain protein
MLRKASLALVLTFACTRPNVRVPDSAAPAALPAVVPVAKAGEPAPPHEPAPLPLTDVAPIPSGMELLYSDRVPIQPNGEPMIAIGIASGKNTVVVSGRGAMTIDFYEGDVFKRATATAGTEVTVQVKRAKAAKRSFNVDLGGVPYGARRELDAAVAKWKARDVGEVHVIEEGTALGLAGRIIDNREWRLWLPAPSRQEAQELAQVIVQRFSERPAVQARLAEHPWAELDVRINGVPLGRAVSFVRFVPGDAESAIEVAGVEYAKGYAWAGREDRAYAGEVYAVVDPDGNLAAVNVLGAETVLTGVVPAEMFASAPLEALKSQAIAARNQLFAKLGRRHHDDPFHLCSEQHCQVYAGLTKRDPRATAAVEATRGEVLFRDGKLVDTVYSSTCGGHTEDNDVVWGNAPDPALRGRPDFDGDAGSFLARFMRGIRDGDLLSWLGVKDTTYCARATQARADRFRWERSFDGADVQRLIAASYPGVGQVRELEVQGRGPGGRVTALGIVGDSGRATVAFELPVRKLFDNLSSGAFALDVMHDDAGHIARATFRGAGWGHGVGLCQMGAIGRAEAGQAYNHILSHYYNGAEPLQVYGVSAGMSAR